MNTSTSVEIYTTPVLSGPVGQARLDRQGESEWRRSGDLIGLAVQSRTDNSRLGTVLDIIFDLDENRAVALILDNNHWHDLMALRIIPWREITQIGRQAVLTISEESRVQLQQDQWAAKAVTAHWEAAFSSTHVLDTSGHFIATLADTCLEDVTGRVLGFDTLTGFEAGTLRGKHFLPKLPARPQTEPLLKT